MSVAVAEPNVIRLALPGQHLGQVRVRRMARRINKVAAGRRWRKSTMGVSIVGAALAETRGRYLWGAPTYDQVRIAWDELHAGAGGAFRFLKSEMAVECPWTGAKLILRSLDDPDNARGHTADGVILDEAADIPEVAWYEVIRPMLMDTGGWAWLLGTPKGMNWFWREHEAARDRADELAVRIPTIGVKLTPEGLVREPHPLENPNVAFAEIERMHQTMPERSFRQEVLAEFVEDAGGVFRGVTDCATGALYEPYPGTFSLGIDWARTQDFTVLTLFDCATNAVVDWDRFSQIDWHVQQQRLLTMYRAWVNQPGTTVTVLAERNSIGDVLIESLQRQDIPVWGFTTTSQTKAELIEALQLAIEQRRIVYPPIPELLAELRAFEMTRLPSGLVRYGAPEGMHDDCVMSLALAHRAAGMPRLDQVPRPSRITIGAQPDRRSGGLLGEHRQHRIKRMLGEE